MAQLQIILFVIKIIIFVYVGPTMPPQNFVAILVTSDSFTLSWTLLPGLEPGGLQSGYVIQCNPGDYMLMVS